MGFNDACLILKTLTDAWSTANGWPVAYHNQTAPAGCPPEPAAPWLEIAFHDVSTIQQSIGAPGENDHEGLGAIVAHIFVPRQEGDDKARVVRDSFNLVFQGKYLSGIEVNDILGDDGGDDTAGWWRRTTRVEFNYQQVA